MTHHPLGGDGSVEKINLSTVQDHAIAARVALITGATTFDRLFSGVRFHAVDGDLL
jgi:hypothetical protein